MNDYWGGFFTLPVILVISVLLGMNWVLFFADLERRFHISFEFRTKRGVGEISDYVLRHNIWWERSFGPVYAGGWYREHLDHGLFNHWIGIGRTSGPCLTAYHKHELGEVDRPMSSLGD